MKISRITLQCNTYVHEVVADLPRKDYALKSPLIPRWIMRVQRHLTPLSPDWHSIRPHLWNMTHIPLNIQVGERRGRSPSEQKELSDARHAYPAVQERYAAPSRMLIELGWMLSLTVQMQWRLSIMFLLRFSGKRMFVSWGCQAFEQTDSSRRSITPRWNCISEKASSTRQYCFCPSEY